MYLYIQTRAGCGKYPMYVTTHEVGPRPKRHLDNRPSPSLPILHLQELPPHKQMEMWEEYYQELFVREDTMLATVVNNTNSLTTVD